MDAGSKWPPIKWAQRKDRVFVTMEIRDLKDEKVLKNGVSESQKYECNFELFENVNPETSKWVCIGLHLQIVLMKKDADKPYWKRLTKDDKKNNFITVDWTKYIDEDDEGEEGQKGLSPDWDPDSMNKFGDEGDSDDEENPNLDDLDKEEPMDNEGKEEKNVEEKNVEEKKPEENVEEKKPEN